LKDIVFPSTRQERRAEQECLTMIVQPVLTVQQTVAVHRNRFPRALVCVVCAVLLATMAASYASSNLTEPDRLAYVCAECRQDAADGAKAKASSAANLSAARAALAHIRVALRQPKSAPDIPSTSNTVLRYSAATVRTGRARQPGRPRTGAAAKRQKARDRVRAYRAQRKAMAA
jgi:hypothetical protein